VRRNIFLSCFLAFGLAACSSHRPAVVGLDNNYFIDVTNAMDHPMNVSLDLGGGVSALGQIEVGQTRRFELRDQMNSKVELIAAQQDGSSEKRREVLLSRTRVAKVLLD
jgi:hypothetical protein